MAGVACAPSRVHTRDVAHRGLVAVAVLAVACGGRTLENVDPNVDACDAYADALCTTAETCKPKVFRLAYGTRAACLDERRWSCLDRLSIEGIGTTTDDVDACRRAFSSLSCDRFAWWETPLAACDPKAGRKPLGARCREGACAAGLMCAYRDGDGDCGRCVPAARDGDGCHDSWDACPGTALACDALKKCRPTVTRALGEACPAPTDVCEFPYHCDPWTFRCEPNKTEDVPCGGFYAGTTWNRCEAYRDVMCDGGYDLGLCRAHVPPAVGEPCTNDDNTCAGDADCHYETRRCVPRGREGDVCFFKGAKGDFAVGCMPGLTCNGDHRCERTVRPSCR